MTTTAAGSEGAILRLADLYDEAWASRDLDSIMRLHTRDTVFAMHVGRHAVSAGAKAVRAAFVAGLALIPDSTFTRRQLRIGSDFWIAELTLSGHRADGAHIEVETVDVVTVREGLVARKDTYLDSAGVRRGAIFALVMRPWLWPRIIRGLPSSPQTGAR